MFEIRDATQCSFEQLRTAMQDAFSDYAIPLQLNAEAFDQMMRQRGLDRSKSRIAVEGGNVVAIWLVSVRTSKAYLISSGTIPSCRSRGISRALAEDCLNGLRKEVVQSFQTEVLRDNKTAAGLYTSLGMTKTRSLDCYLISVQEAPTRTQPTFSSMTWSDIASSVEMLRDWAPSWQNSDPSLDAISEQLVCLTRDDGAGLTAYAVCGLRSGNIHQLAVRPDLRRNGLGTDLVRALQHRLPHAPLRFTNVHHDDFAFRSLIKHVGATETAGQYELLMAL